MSVKPIGYVSDFFIQALSVAGSYKGLAVAAPSQVQQNPVYDQSAIDQLTAEISQQRSNAAQIAKDTLDKARERNDEIDALRAEIARLQK
jgi:hypothetical protein